MARRPRVAQLGFHVDVKGRAPAELLRDWWTLVDVAESAAAAGAHVSVIQACTQSGMIRRNGIDYHFIAPGRISAGIGRTAQFAQLIRELQPDLFHVHGLDMPADVLALSGLAPSTPIFAQDHAGAVPRFWRRRNWARIGALMTGIAFCNREQAQPFLNAGLIRPHTKVYEIPECPSRFTPGDRQAARAASGLYGDPCVLSVGHLNANKDPLTLLDGVSQASRQLPEIQLWCCFTSAPLLSEVRNRIAGDPALTGRVHLLGFVAHERVENLMRAADLFVSASHAEGSGYSLIEAMACGLPPVVTDIASFRALTANGAMGALWRCGDSMDLCNALLSTAVQARAALRARVRNHFVHELSLQAVGQKLLRAYADVLRTHTPLQRPRPARLREL